MNRNQQQPRISEKDKNDACATLYERIIKINTKNCVLPDPTAYFKSDEWEYLKLVQAREELNDVKSLPYDIERKEWERLASDTNYADRVKFVLRKDFQVEMATIAWAKMYESIVVCDLLPDQHPALTLSGPQPTALTIHLCEAPGAFICATNHYQKTHRPHWEWNWIGMTLNPHFEGNDQFAMVDDDKLINKTWKNWFFGNDDSGDIRQIDNIPALWARATKTSPGKALLVTADGAVDCSMDPNRQEAITASLHYAELVAALGVLAHGGSFIWKAFTLYEHPSICSLFLMACLFDSVAVYKPSTSKPANSEVYVVGKGFRGIGRDHLEALLSHVGEDTFKERAMFARDVFPLTFVDTMHESAVKFGQYTADAIRAALEMRGHPSEERRVALRNAKSWFANKWMEDLDVRFLDRQDFLAPSANLDGSSNNTSNVVGRKRGLQGM